MRTSKDGASPPGPPPGPALRPLPSLSNNNPSISLFKLEGPSSQISTARRGAVSGKDMAQIPAAKLLLSSRLARKNSQKDECLEPGSGCPWCFPHGSAGSDLFFDNGIASHQAPTHNPARTLTFGGFADYEINRSAPAAFEGDTLIDQENYQSAPVSPKTIFTSPGESILSFCARYFSNCLTASTATSGVFVRPLHHRVVLPRTCHLRSLSTQDEFVCPRRGTSDLFPRPRFAAHTTIDQTAAPLISQGHWNWDLPIGDSRGEAYSFTQEEINVWKARVWAHNVDRNIAKHQRKGKEPEHTGCDSAMITSSDGNSLQHPQLRGLLSSSSSLSIIGESTSSLSAADCHRNSSGNTFATNISNYRDSSGSYIHSSPPLRTPEAVEHWRRISYGRTQEGQPYISAADNPALSFQREESADAGVIPSQPQPQATASHHQQPQQQQQQQASDPSPAKVTDIFSVRPLATRRPFEPARYVDGGPHANSHPSVRPDGNFSHPLTTSITLPNLSGTQANGGQGGLHGALPRSQAASEIGAEDSKNTCLWLEGLPPNITYAELIGSIKNCGRVYSTYINPPIAHHQTSAAKLAFFTRAGAERLYAQATREQFTIRNQRIFVRWNRNAYTENPRHGSSCTRILLIRGPKKWVNETTLTSYFTSLFWSNICRIDEVSMDVAAAWAGSNWLENGEQGKLSLPERFREFAAMRWEFASFHSQASSAKTAIESETAFGGLIKVNFLSDPCDYTGLG